MNLTIACLVLALFAVPAHAGQGTIEETDEGFIVEYSGDPADKGPEKPATNPRPGLPGAVPAPSPLPQEQPAPESAPQPAPAGSEAAAEATKQPPIPVKPRDSGRRSRPPRVPRSDADRPGDTGE